MGGILVIGIVVAPAIFGSAKAQGQTDLSQPLYRFAGEAMGEAFRRFNYVVLAAGVILLIAGWGYGSLAGLCRRRMTVRAILTAVALAIAGWTTFGLYPELVRTRSAGEMTAFDQLHHTYSFAFQGQLLLLVTVAALTAWMHLDRDASAAHESQSDTLPTAQRAISH
jgi:hypothetical protein